VRWCILATHSARGDIGMARSRSSEPLTIGGFLIRFVLATGLVLATYNPSGYSFVAWFRDGWSAGTLGAPHYFVAVLLLIGWVILLRATFNSLGALGLILGAALLGTLVWLLVDLGVLSGTSFTFYEWIVQICVGALLAIGLSWSHIWRRLTGQVDVDDFDSR
jgi:hypothetical protein